MKQINRFNIEDTDFYDANKIKKVDLFNIRILGLLICRGDIFHKGGLLYDVLIKPSKRSTQNSFLSVEDDSKKCVQLSWSSVYLKKAMKNFLYYSEILPKAYVEQYRDFTKERLMITTRMAKDIDKLMKQKPGQPSKLNKIETENEKCESSKKK